MQFQRLNFERQRLFRKSFVFYRGFQFDDGVYDVGVIFDNRADVRERIIRRVERFDCLFLRFDINRNPVNRYGRVRESVRIFVGLFSVYYKFDIDVFKRNGNAHHRRVFGSFKSYRRHNVCKILFEQR